MNLANLLPEEQRPKDNTIEEKYEGPAIKDCHKTLLYAFQGKCLVYKGLYCQYQTEEGKCKLKENTA